MSDRMHKLIPVVLGVAGIVFIILGIMQSGGDDGQSAAPAPTTAPTTVAPAPTTAAPAPTTAAPAATTAAPAATTTTPPPPTTTATTSPPATTTTAPPPPTTTTVPPETPEEFLALFVEGLRGNVDFLVERLNQATLDIYGADQCRTRLAELVDPDTDLTLREVGDVGPWEYAIDGIVTTIDDVLAVEVNRLIDGQTVIQEVHWKLVDGRWTWFSDCGDPLTSSA